MLTAIALLDLGLPPPVGAQPAPAPCRRQADSGQFDVQQLDALLAPIALYPDSC